MLYLGHHPQGLPQPMSEHNKDVKFCEHGTRLTGIWAQGLPIDFDKTFWKQYCGQRFFLVYLPSFAPSSTGSDLHHSVRVLPASFSSLLLFLHKCFPSETPYTCRALLASASQRTQSDSTSGCQALCYVVKVPRWTRETWSWPQGAHCLKGLPEINTEDIGNECNKAA